MLVQSQLEGCLPVQIRIRDRNSLIRWVSKHNKITQTMAIYAKQARLLTK